MTAATKRQRGFTLTELMVVVAIIGVLTTMAFAYMRPRITSRDVSNRVGQLVREASRRAVTLGPVRADVATWLGSKARTRIVSTGGTNPTFTLQYLVENALPANTGNWVTAMTYTTYRDVQIESYGDGVGAHGALSLNTNMATFVLTCSPDGTCDSKTIFFQSPEASSRERYSRLSIMPLGAALYTRGDWN